MHRAALKCEKSGIIYRSLPQKQNFSKKHYFSIQSNHASNGNNQSVCMYKVATEPKFYILSVVVFSCCLGAFAVSQTIKIRSNM